MPLRFDTFTIDGKLNRHLKGFYAQMRLLPGLAFSATATLTVLNGGTEG